MGKITEQQQWSRYRAAINFCISQGVLVDMKDSKGSLNVKRLRVKWDPLMCTNSKETIITLKPKKYGTTEIFGEVVNTIGGPGRLKTSKEFEEEFVKDM